LEFLIHALIWKQQTNTSFQKIQVEWYYLMFLIFQN